LISCEAFYETLVRNGIDFFAGVPDSLLKDFCAFLKNRALPKNHFVAANEGGAAALAAGHFLATGRPGLVYMQNSGLGNAVNPITSLLDDRIYGIPVVFLIGWRGEPGVTDEPQHAKQGLITLDLLETLDISYWVMEGEGRVFQRRLDRILHQVQKRRKPFALVARKGFFEKVVSKKTETALPLSREEAIRVLVDTLGRKDAVVSTTGFASRELFEIRERRKQSHDRDFLCVGSMGHASQIALSIALARPERQVYCLDGDGSAIMHLGALAIAGTRRATNFKHVVLNNGVHDSVGGQPTAGFDLDWGRLAKACGYRSARTVTTVSELRKEAIIFHKAKGPALLEIRLGRHTRSDLMRPTLTPAQIKVAFMRFLKK